MPFRFCKGIVIFRRTIVSYEYNECGCWPIEKFSFRYQYFALIDTADYLADQLFIKHKVRVWFGEEFCRDDMPYRVIICRCRKRDVRAFMAAASELSNKRLLCGHPDYPAFCDNLRQKILDRRSMGGGDHNETACASEKAEQKSAKRASCQAAR